MYIPKDPFMLLSFINTELRDHYQSLDDFCSANGVDRESIEHSLRDAGYVYDSEHNTFSES